MPTVHLLVKGKVQGVFYRASAKKIAEALDLQGWIKNTAEGAVEATISGGEKAVQQFIEWCKTGPEAAIVMSVNVTAVDDKSFEGFDIRRG